MEKLVCDRCNAEYTDEDSLRMAKDYSETWAKVHKQSLGEPRGLCPCPRLDCTGELILEEG